MLLHLKMHLLIFSMLRIKSVTSGMLRRHSTTKLCSKLHLIFKSISHMPLHQFPGSLIVPKP